MNKKQSVKYSIITLGIIAIFFIISTLLSSNASLVSKTSKHISTEEHPNCKVMCNNGNFIFEDQDSLETFPFPDLSNMQLHLLKDNLFNLRHNDKIRVLSFTVTRDNLNRAIKNHTASHNKEEKKVKKSELFANHLQAFP